MQLAYAIWRFPIAVNWLKHVSCAAFWFDVIVCALQMHGPSVLSPAAHVGSALQAFLDVAHV